MPGSRRTCKSLAGEEKFKLCLGTEKEKGKGAISTPQRGEV